MINLHFPFYLVLGQEELHGCSFQEHRNSRKGSSIPSRSFFNLCLLHLSLFTSIIFLLESTSLFFSTPDACPCCQAVLTTLLSFFRSVRDPQPKEALSPYKSPQDVFIYCASSQEEERPRKFGTPCTSQIHRFWPQQSLFSCASATPRGVSSDKSSWSPSDSLLPLGYWAVSSALSTMSMNTSIVDGWFPSNFPMWHISCLSFSTLSPQ